MMLGDQFIVRVELVSKGGSAAAGDGRGLSRSKVQFRI